LIKNAFLPMELVLFGIQTKVEAEDRWCGGGIVGVHLVGFSWAY
jgi:hypothetical protein